MIGDDLARRGFCRERFVSVDYVSSHAPKRKVELVDCSDLRRILMAGQEEDIDGAPLGFCFLCCHPTRMNAGVPSMSNNGNRVTMQFLKLLSIPPLYVCSRDITLRLVRTCCHVRINDPHGPRFWRLGLRTVFRMASFAASSEDTEPISRNHIILG
jgi:hypothetical protein